MQANLVLAIDDATFGPLIRKTRITTPEERTIDSRIRRVREKMEEAGALDFGRSPHAKKNQAKLDLIPENPAILLDLEQAYLDEAEQFALGIWVSSDSYIIHDEAVHIMQYVVETYRSDLQGHRLAVVMAQKIAPVLRRHRLGTATKLPGKMRFLSSWDALITLDFEQWRMLTDKDRQRLIHHELEHLERGDAGLQLRTHDFEDFTSVVGLYGLRSESERFSTDGRVAETLRREAAQLELIPRSA